jgi:hypothetical protein
LEISIGRPTIAVAIVIRSKLRPWPLFATNVALHLPSAIVMRLAMTTKQALELTHP